MILGYWGAVRARLRLPALLLCTSLAAAMPLAACSSRTPSANANEPTARPAVPVVVARVVAKTVPVKIQAIGNVEPRATVAIKARVDGQIVKVYFRDGQEIAAGEPLFQLDSRSFQALLAQAQATLARDRAQLERARAQEARYKDLLQRKFVSEDAYAQFRTNAATAAATVRADEAAVESARLQLEYATIRSPIAGRAGTIMVPLGNLVKANDTGPLVVINQMSPVYVSFAVPERYLTEIREYMAAGPLAVRARLRTSGENAGVVGKLAYIDNAVDTATGTVKLHAVFENRNEALWPGQFVTAVLTLHEQHDAITVPSQAVQTGPEGKFVFVVRSDLTAEVRAVEVERVDGPQTVIAKGLVPGERVITSGQLGLVSGSRVKPTSETAQS